jgi:glycosyltransferase involved in cell wall biosynthesis
MNESRTHGAMNLLFVHQNLGAHGGAEANILLTATELKSRGHKVALLHASSTGRSEAGWRAVFSECFQLPGKNVLPFVDSVLEEFVPNVIYLHNLADLELIESLLLSGVPVARMVHDHAMYCMRGYKYNYFTRAICTRPASLACVFPCLACVTKNPDRSGLPVKWTSYADKRKEIVLNRQCQRLVVYSRYSRNELIGNGFDPVKIHIHVPIRCWGAKGPVSSFSDRNLILFAGQIIRGKGVDLLLKALARIRTPFECLILGDGNHKSYCQKLCAKLGLNDRVQFRGFIPQEELQQYYLDASVFAVSSVWPEPFGMVGPEAMRYGLPVVAFDAGAIQEWLIDGENGFLVPWMDIDAFAARTEELLSNKSLARQMGRNGLERVNQQYDSVRQIDGLENLFREMGSQPNVIESSYEKTTCELFDTTAISG